MTSDDAGKVLLDRTDHLAFGLVPTLRDAIDAQDVQPMNDLFLSRDTLVPAHWQVCLWRRMRLVEDAKERNGDGGNPELVVAQMRHIESGRLPFARILGQLDAQLAIDEQTALLEVVQLHASRNETNP